MSHRFAVPTMTHRRFMVSQKDNYFWLMCYEKLSTTVPIVDVRMKNVLTAIKMPMSIVGLTLLVDSSTSA